MRRARSPVAPKMVSREAGEASVTAWGPAWGVPKLNTVKRLLRVWIRFQNGTLVYVLLNHPGNTHRYVAAGLLRIERFDPWLTQ